MVWASDCGDLDLGFSRVGNVPHNNLMPYLTFNFCIALQGIYG